jgi:hypothetical protein
MPQIKPTEARSDRIVRLQIFAAFLVPLVLLGLWLGSRGFFQAP